MEFLVVLAILALVVFAVSAPLRREGGRAGRERVRSGETADLAQEIADLEAAREAKYREIRDAELDHRTGKLSDADYEAVDETLRSEAVDILHALDRVVDRAGATIDER